MSAHDWVRGICALIGLCALLVALGAAVGGWLLNLPSGVKRQTRRLICALAYYVIAWSLLIPVLQDGLTARAWLRLLLMSLVGVWVQREYRRLEALRALDRALCGTNRNRESA